MLIAMSNSNLISVIIATHNRPETLKLTLDSLLAQQCDNSFNYKIMIVDNNSSSQTKELIESYTTKFNGRLKYIFEPKKGKSYALNKGIKESEGEIIALTDDDCMPEKDWLSKIYSNFTENNNLEVILGKAVYEDNMPFYLNKEILRGNGLNLSFRKRLIEEIGNFDNHFGPGSIGCAAEDTDFVYRVHKKNKNIAIVEDIKVIHKLRKSEQERIKCIYRDAKSVMIFWSKHFLKEGDVFALKNIYWNLTCSLSQLLKEIKNKSKERMVLKAVQSGGAIVGLIKGAYIWLILDPMERLCQR